MMQITHEQVILKSIKRVSNMYMYVHLAKPKGGAPGLGCLIKLTQDK